MKRTTLTILALLIGPCGLPFALHAGAPDPNAPELPPAPDAPPPVEPDPPLPPEPPRGAVNPTPVNEAEAQPAERAAPPMTVRRWSVPASLRITLGGGDPNEARRPLKELLQEHGIEFGPGSSAQYLLATQTLVVTNTEENLARVENLIERLARDEATIAGQLTEVTLYQGTALVTRHVDLPAGAQGPLEVIVSPLPTATDPASVFADRAEGVEIRSVACRSRPPAEEEKRQGAVAELEAAIQKLEQDISVSRNEIALRRIRQEYLNSLGRFVAPAVSQEMAHGVLQADEIEQITRMHFEEYETASQEIMELDFAIEDSQERLAELKKEREKLAAGPPVTYDAVLYLDKPEAGEASLTLNYLVADCGWSPVYNVRGDTAQNEIEIEFNALIHQVSGEDWKGVTLSLSTASPTVSAYNPQLAPLFVRLSDDPGQQMAQQAEAADNTLRYNQALDQRTAALAGQLRGQSIDEAALANFNANDSAASVQLIELSERMSELRRLREDRSEEILSIEYELERPVTLVSRRDAQMVPVLGHRGEADFYHVAVPILTSAVFREAELTNATEQDLLGGTVNVYLDGRFTGRTEMPTIAQGRNFTLGFGVDGQLRARRSLLDRREAVQGGNQKVEISVEVIVDNYKAAPVNLHLRERTPTMEDAASLRVSLGEMSQPLSADPDYQRFERPKGILRWELEVPPGSGQNATALRYGYALEFDKSQMLQDITREHKTRVRTEFIQQSKRSLKGKE